jgi:pimeloyl-ACP methyl ester carboxylesterase
MNGGRQADERLKGMRDALARRAALARRPRPDGTRAPSLKLLLAEIASLRRGRRPPLAVARATNPQPVMLLPGFGAHPKRMKPMFDALVAAGHDVHEWGLGFNFGPNQHNFAFLMRRVGALARQHRTPVALVGWSLGGLFAREIACRQPDSVSKVITMGTPFSGDPRNNNAWRAYEVVTGHAVDEPPIECDFSIKPPVPTIALWGPRDGVIHPRSACGWADERDRAVSVRCSHLGFASDPKVIAEVLRQLDRED